MPDTDLASLHTFAMPARAHHLLVIDQPEQLLGLAQDAALDWQKLRILAGGSNSIFLHDVEQLLLKIELKGKSLVQRDAETVLVEAAAGEHWDDFVAWTLAHQAFGLENLSLIPGSVGASPIQNIGAYGVEAGDLIESIQVFDWKTAAFRWLAGDECQFAYRDSRFKHDWSHLIIVKVRFRLQSQFHAKLGYAGLIQADSADDVRRQVIALRQSKLPDPQLIPNAGSFFHNPVVLRSKVQQLLQQYPQMPFYKVDESHSKIPAAWLLDQAGFKGRWHHGFGCYKKQPLVVIHDPAHPGALAEKRLHFCQWVEQIQSEIHLKFGIQLHPEPVIV